MRTQNLAKSMQQSLSDLVLFSLVMTLVAGFSHCKQGANPIEQTDVECGPFLLADSVYAGRTRVVCQDSTLRSTIEDCSSPFGGLAFASYSNVTWHPSGQFIAFGHVPLERILFPNGRNCPGQQIFDQTAGGYWLSDIDGSHMRRIRTIAFSNPAWSPDGQWLAFNKDAQIYKIHFNGNCFDESTLTKITTEGRNFSPAWSPNGQWIVYRRSFASYEPITVQGIWIIKSDGTENKQIFQGNVGEPYWHPTQDKIIFYRGGFGVDGDSLWTYSIETKESISFAFLQGEILTIRYSPDGQFISLGFRPKNDLINIWIMNEDGTDLRRITTDGGKGWHDWSPDSRKIIYIRHRYDNWTYCNGTLWTVDVFTGEKRQITFNYLPNSN